MLTSLDDTNENIPKDCCVARSNIAAKLLSIPKSWGDIQQTPTQTKNHIYAELAENHTRDSSIWNDTHARRSTKKPKTIELMKTKKESQFMHLLFVFRGWKRTGCLMVTRPFSPHALLVCGCGGKARWIIEVATQQEPELARRRTTAANSVSHPKLCNHRRSSWRWSASELLLRCIGLLSKAKFRGAYWSDKVSSYSNQSDFELLDIDISLLSWWMFLNELFPWRAGLAQFLMWKYVRILVRSGFELAITFGYGSAIFASQLHANSHQHRGLVFKLWLDQNSCQMVLRSVTSVQLSFACGEVCEVVILAHQLKNLFIVI
jgi:hypothetical protein